MEKPISRKDGRYTYHIEKATNELRIVLSQTEFCKEVGCKNVFYRLDRLSPVHTMPLCRKHYRMYALSWGEHEAKAGKRDSDNDIESQKIKKVAK